MKPRAAAFLLVTTVLFAGAAAAQAPGNVASARRITLREAVQLALKHNHDVRIAGYKVEEKEHAKQVAKSSYFPSIRNDSNFMHVTDTELIEIRAGGLGIAGGAPIPPVNSIINQGGRNLTTSGTQITQPLTTLLKIKQENDLAQADLKASREKAQLTGNDVALSVHQVYYQILIAQARRSATEARIKAAEALQSERAEQVRLGSSLQENLIDSRAQQLQAKQELLTTDFQLTDLALKLNDLREPRWKRPKPPSVWPRLISGSPMLTPLPVTATRTMSLSWHATSEPLAFTSATICSTVGVSTA
jgi:outer membrane protein TolC